MSSITDTPTIQDKAREAFNSFEIAHRTEASDSSYARLKDGAPEWVRDVVYAAHHGFSDFFPDDWRYQKTMEALEWIADADDPEDSSGEFADNAVDVYTSDRLAWLASNLNRPTYCDEAASEFGGGTRSDSSDIVAMIGWGQYAEASEIYGLVLAELEKLTA